MAEHEEPGTSESLASATFTTASSDGSEGEHSGGEASESSSRSCAEPEGLLSRLKAADRSVLCRKRSMAANPSVPSRKRSKKSSVRCSSSVTPHQRAKEFSSEFIGLSAGKPFCRACREELSLKKSSIQQALSIQLGKRN